MRETETVIVCSSACTLFSTVFRKISLRTAIFLARIWHKNRTLEQCRQALSMNQLVYK